MGHAGPGAGLRANNATVGTHAITSKAQKWEALQAATEKGISSATNFAERMQVWPKSYLPACFISVDRAVSLYEGGVQEMVRDTSGTSTTLDPGVAIMPCIIVLALVPWIVSEG